MKTTSTGLPVVFRSDFRQSPFLFVLKTQKCHHSINNISSRYRRKYKGMRLENVSNYKIYYRYPDLQDSCTTIHYKMVYTFVGLNV